MAEVDTARPPGVIPARRKGFIAFCAVVSALIAAMLLHPLTAAADHPGEPGRHGASSGRSEPRATDRSRPQAPRARDVASVAETPGRTFARILATGEPVYCGAGTQPLVALTFDDGPGPMTEQTLRLLRERRMTATFFLAGKLLADPRFDRLPSAAARLGAVGNHTWDHVPTVGLSATDLAAQIGRTQRAISAATGERVALFRPPLGRHDARGDAYVRSLRMITVLWSVDTGDSMGASADHIVRVIRSSLSPGDIVLLHENRGSTQRALPRILDLVEARGYSTVTVPELLALDPPDSRQLRTGTCPA